MNVTGTPSYIQISEMPSIMDKPKSATCIETASMKDISNYLETLEEGSLVVFDLDNTTIQPSNPALQMKVVSRPENWEIVRETFKKMSEEENAIFRGVYTLEEQGSSLMDPILPQIFKNLKDKNIKAIALSSAFVGNINGKSMKEERYNVLKKLEIDFSESFESKEIVFHQLESLLGYHPVYYKGILLTNRERNSKGEIIRAFLETTSYRPKKIVFVDDMRHNIESVEKTLDEMKISYQNFFYTGSQNYPKEDIANDKFLAVWSKLVKETKEISANLSQK